MDPTVNSSLTCCSSDTPDMSAVGKVVLAGFFAAILGYASGQTGPDAPCGRGDDWEPYEDQSCIMVLDLDDFEAQTKEDAADTCYNIERRYTDRPRLLTIKTKEKLQFVQNYLYDASVEEPVWLGLALNEDNVFRWEDGSNMYVSPDPLGDSADPNLRCVEMVVKSEGDSSQWNRVSCQKRNVVVCEKFQVWPVQKLLNSLINLKLECAKQETETNQQIASIKDELGRATNNQASSAEVEIMSLKNNPVPVGFVYFQLPYQSPPQEIWPQVTWREVSEFYEGNFFRVVGGESGAFEDVQTQSSPRLERVECISEAEKKYLASTIPMGGGWSDPVSMGWRSDGSQWRGLKFRMSTDETRPVNMAIKVWQRQK